tara:strand:- start:3367 stop:4968 length:1602 start_codon:yes stop_codon:yes gene_type:complete
MCGILAVFGGSPISVGPLERRGPDQTGAYSDEDVWLAHARLAVVTPEAEPQPFVTENWILTINGEVYNAPRVPGQTDCAHVIQLLDAFGALAPRYIDGVFSFVAWRPADKTIVVARDAIGVTPLYMGAADGALYFSSLLDALPHRAGVSIVPPGTSAAFQLGEMPGFVPWTRPYSAWRDLALTTPDDTLLVKQMVRAVEKRLMGDVPWGVLLSGGLDSTIVAAIAANIASKRTDYPVVHTFCIGLADSPDVHWAKCVAAELGTHHTSFEYTVADGLAAIPETIRAIETYDVTTIRAGTPMWLMGRLLKRRGIKVVLSGEGSDELFAGYLYNLMCPSERAMVDECRRKMELLHSYDCARANKTLGDWGVETRVPFLDADVVDFAMNKMHPRFKLSGTHPDGARPEKWWLRETFRAFIPSCVRERTKAQFSDAVGGAWIQGIRDWADARVDDITLEQAASVFPESTPHSKEAYMFRSIFEARFPQRDAVHTVEFNEASIACSTGPAAKWHAGFEAHLDPSGDSVARAVQKIQPKT